MHKYEVVHCSSYNRNIFVSKMYKIILKFLKGTKRTGALYLFDGPDFHSNQFDVANMTDFSSNSFQVSIMYLGYYDDIRITFSSDIAKYTLQNYNNSIVKHKFPLKSGDLGYTNLDNFCAFNFQVTSDSYVNVTILSFLYSGPNVGYCKYGGFSISDFVNNTLKEISLVCESLDTLTNRIIVSHTESLFLILYSYWPYSESNFSVTVQPTMCKGVHVQRLVSY